MNEKAPLDEHLKHRAIISTVNYRLMDGPYPAGSTDTRALSLGKSTWEPAECSAKVWRHNGHKWKRASEDIPMHRALDLTILILSAMLAEKEDYTNHFLDLEIVDHASLPQLQTYLEQQKPHLEERLHEIRLLLKKYFK